MAVDQLDLDVVEVALRGGGRALGGDATNPLLRVADLAALGALAAAAGAPFVVDNTAATGLLQKPLQFGAVASVYSLTKSISGHSDVLGGAAVTRDAALAESVRGWRTAGGGDPRAVRELARAARDEDAAAADRAAIGERPRDRGVPGRAPAGDRGALSGAGPVGGGAPEMPAGFGPLLSFELAGTAAGADAVVAAARACGAWHQLRRGGVDLERRARWAAETAPRR